jgi:hypothetical protein
MLVFNLTEQVLTYRRRALAANGGSFNFLDLRRIPARDQALAKGPHAVLAFGKLPDWWVEKQKGKKAKQKAAAKAALANPQPPKKAVPPPPPAPEAPPKDAK